MWRWWTMPGRSAMQRNHRPPSLTAVGSGHHPGARAFGFAGAKPAYDLEAGVQRSTVIGRLDREPPTQLDAGQALLALGEQVHGAKPHPHRLLIVNLEVDFRQWRVA